MGEPGGGSEKELPPECKTGEHDLTETAATARSSRDGVGGYIRNYRCSICKRAYTEDQLSSKDLDEDDGDDED